MNRPTTAFLGSRSLRSLLACAGIAVGGLMLTGVGGCVAQEDYDRLHQQIDSLENRNGVLMRERDAAVKALADANAALAANEEALNALRRINGELTGRLQGMGANLNDLMAQLDGLKLSALDPDTNALLRELANQYPDLITFDEAKGMLRFNSDLTFNSGDDTVKPEGRQALTALANILNNPVASSYDVIVLGHTDSQPIGRSASRHPTNIHLSVHRAIAVRRVLTEQSVAGDKMQVAGWGEFRPAVPNTPSGNTPQNRRVEIYLTRHKGSEASGSASAAPANVEAPRTATPSGGGSPNRPSDVLK
ncbi:MAG: OmpA family protein [Tepidisphaera sp.]|jgi:chemotaxis protein MotB